MRFNKAKILSLALVFSSLIGYLEWGEDQQRFLFQMEWELITKFLSDPMSTLHPFTVLPLIGQILLIVSVFQRKTNRTLSLVGMLFLGLLLYLVFFIGLISLNLKIILFSFPYILFSILTILYHRKK